MKQLAIFLTIRFCMSLVSCKEVEEAKPLEEEPFVGSWRVISARLDDVEKPEWEGVIITITQDSIGKGFYYVPDSPEKPVWPEMGRWNMPHPEYQGFTTDQLLEVTYFHNGSTSFLRFYHPRYMKPCPPNKHCPAILTGDWRFEVVTEPDN